MDSKTFEIMYQALVEIATAEAFFEREKKMSQIAKKALQDIGKLTIEENSSEIR